MLHEKEIEELKKEIKLLEKNIERKQKGLSSLLDEQKAKDGYMYAGVNIKNRKASYLLTREDGLKLFIPKATNTHNERNVYLGSSKGRKVIENTHRTHRKIALWFKNATTEEL